MQKWVVRIVNLKALQNGASFNSRDEKGKFDVVFNKVYAGKTPKAARKTARKHYPTKDGWRLGFTHKQKAKAK